MMGMVEDRHASIAEAIRLATERATQRRSAG
jgi:hypothetical protein